MKKQKFEYIQDWNGRVVSIRDITGFVICHYTDKWESGNIFYLCAITGAQLPFYGNDICYHYLNSDKDPDEQLSESKQIKIYSTIRGRESDTITVQGIYVIDKVDLGGSLPETVDFDELLMDALMMWTPTVSEIMEIHNKLIWEKLYVPDIDHSQSRFFSVEHIGEVEGVELMYQTGYFDKDGWHDYEYPSAD